MTTSDCYSCAEEQHLSVGRPEGAIWIGDEWRVAHAMTSAMLGWLVVIPRRHVEGPHELNAVEAAALGPLLQQASQALVNVLGCSKTYVIMFAETPGFTHLHFHVVPRDAQLPTRLRGTNVFEFMRKPEADWVPLEQQRELVLRLRAASGDRGQ